MAGSGYSYWRNHSSSDSASVYTASSSTPISSFEYFSSLVDWEAPEGKVFSEWNTSRDGSGISFQPGDTYTLTGEDLYAIYENEPTPYKVTDTQLNSIADAINTKAGTTGQLQFPDGFVSAINAIPTGGGDMISFSVGNYSYLAEQGMTWGEFVNSEYNVAFGVASEFSIAPSTNHITCIIDRFSFDVNRQSSGNNWVLQTDTIANHIGYFAVIRYSPK